MDDIEFKEIENSVSDIQLNDISIEEEKPKREYKKKKKIDSEKESNSVITILQFFSEKLLRNKIPDKDVEFHKETIRQIADQYEISISEYILIARIVVSLGMILIHYYISTLLLFRKKEIVEKAKVEEKTKESE